ncbi:MAG: penicillin-binding transpeptidase domain-containing protein [Gemmatimonadota bacterium]
MAKFETRLTVVQVGLGLALVAAVVQAGRLQLVRGREFSAQAANARTVREVLPARRGAILDRNGVPLAISQEYYHVGLAPNEFIDAQAAVRAVARALAIPPDRLRRDTRSGKAWLYYHGPFTAAQVEPLRRVKGVHLEGEYARFYPAQGLARPIIGVFDPDSSVGGSGLELVLDSLLRGVPGEATVQKDRAGRRYDSPSRRLRSPIAGGDVYLTLDAELQDIAEQGLGDALEALDADGGDIVFLDPRSGEILALASRQLGGSSTRPSSITDPFEPGSTAKLFTAAALVALGRVDDNDAVSGENGYWKMPIDTRGNTREITDVHPEPGRVTLARAVAVSSNIAMAKFSQRLQPAEQYEQLRAFGFGSPTGVEYPAESRGILARPERWTMLTRPSLAIGYEFGVTPLQLAAAYAAIAADGILLTPALVREIRSNDGAVVYRHRPEPVRRAVSSEVAARLREFLRGVVAEGGTGEMGQLANYPLLGKTGTARRFRDGTYVPGELTASFAAMFPADDPQLVVVVKLDSPRKGSGYGGTTAAPVVRRMLEQALASRRVAIDRARLTGGTGTRAPAPDRQAPADVVPRQAVVVAWPPVSDTTRHAPVAVPSVTGQGARSAALALHRRGLHVDLRGLGRVVRSEPTAGTAVEPGSIVTIWAE